MANVGRTAATQARKKKQLEAAVNAMKQRNSGGNGASAESSTSPGIGNVWNSRVDGASDFVKSQAQQQRKRDAEITKNMVTWSGVRKLDENYSPNATRKYGASNQNSEQASRNTNFRSVALETMKQRSKKKIGALDYNDSFVPESNAAQQANQMQVPQKYKDALNSRRETPKSTIQTQIDAAKQANGALPKNITIAPNMTQNTTLGATRSEKPVYTGTPQDALDAYKKTLADRKAQSRLAANQAQAEKHPLQGAVLSAASNAINTAITPIKVAADKFTGNKSYDYSRFANDAEVYRQGAVSGTQQALNVKPDSMAGKVTSGAVSMGINLASSLPIFGAVASGISSIPALASMSPTVSNIISTSGAMGLTTAADEAGAYADSDTTGSRYLQDILVNSAAGAAGSLTSSGITAAGAKLLKNKGLSYNRLARSIVAGLSSSAYAGADTGTKQLARELGYDDGQKVTKEQLVQDLLTGFAFGVVNDLLRGSAYNDSQAVGGEQIEENYFKGVSDADLKSAYRKMAKAMHPDNGGDAAAFAQMSKEYYWRLANAAAGAYKRGAQATASNRTDEAAQANSEFKDGVRELLTVLKEQPTNENVQAAVEILTNVSDQPNVNDTSTTQGEAQSVVDAALDKIKKEKNGRKTADQDVIALTDTQEPQPDIADESRQAVENTIQNVADESRNEITATESTPEEAKASTQAAVEAMKAQNDVSDDINAETTVEPTTDVQNDIMGTTPTEVAPTLNENIVTSEESLKSPSNTDTYTAPDTSMSTVELSPDSPSVNLPTIEDRAKQYTGKARELYENGFDGNDILTYDENMAKVYDAASHGETLNTLMVNEPGFYDFLNKYGDTVLPFYDAVYENTTRMKNSLGGNNNDAVRKELTVRDGGAVQQPVEVRNGTSGGHDRVRAEENESNEGRGQSVPASEENRGSDVGSVSEPSGHGVSGLRGVGSSEGDQVQSDGFGSGRELNNPEERYTIKRIGGNSYVWDNKLDKSVSSAYVSSFDDERITSVLAAIRSTKDMNRYSVKEVGNHEYYVWDNETDTAVSKKYPAMNLAKYVLDNMRVGEFKKSKSDSDTKPGASDAKPDISGSSAESKRFTVSEFDKESGTYSVWDNEKDRAFSKYKTKVGADKAAERLNAKETQKSATDLAPKKQDEDKPPKNTEVAKPKKQEKAAPKQAVTEKEQADQKVAIATQPEPKGTNYVLTPAVASEIPTTESKRVSANVDAIRTIKDILTGDRLATAEEQTILAKYTGWGGISDSKWNEVEGKLSNILTKDELEAARSSKTDAFYTDPSVIRGIYTGLENIGFHGGRILEPSAGVGRFVGALPQNLIPGSRWTAVELDPITGNIAKALYPNSDVRVQGFETVKIPKGFMDTVVGNVPFGSYGVSDKSYPDYITSKIHNYFIAKSLDALRPGGIACLVTSSGTLNSHDEKARAYFTKKADLIGAIRLPNSAFKGTGTSVVSDVLVFQKRADGTPYKGEAFEKMGWLPNGDYANEYFINHPDMVLGTRRVTTGQFGRGVITYDEDTSKGSLEKQIAKAFWNIDRKMEYPEVSHREVAVESLKQARNNKVGTAYKKDGKLFTNNDGNEVELKLEAKQAAIYSDAVDIRDTARDLIEAMRTGAPDEEIQKVRDRMNRQYDRFKEKYKNGFHTPAVKAALKNDTDYAFLQALEKVKKKEVTKADIFTKNTINPAVDITHVDTVADGVEVSIGQVGYIDPERIAKLAGKTIEATKKELETGDIAYKDANGNYISAESYLSGNVRAKLKEAQFLAEGDKSFQRNVDALKKVVPKDVKGSEIDVNLGVTWIPPQVYAEFAEHLMGASKGSITVNYSSENGYTMSYRDFLRNRAENTSVWGTKKMPFLYGSKNEKGMFMSIMNNNELKITFKNIEGKTEIDRNATEAVRAMKDKITTEFNNWLWKDAERTKTLEQVYNDSFNAMAKPHYHSAVTIAGQTPDITLREHQGSAVNRIVQSPYNTLLQHGAGAGKTFAMIGAAMKLKQLGVAKKPVFVVPKKKVGDFASDTFKMFPNAKVLLADSTTFASANRKEFMNRIATTDFDILIISHDQFKNIPMSDEYKKNFYQKQLDTVMAQIEEAQKSAGKKATIFKMAAKKKSLEKKLQDYANIKQDTDNITFEDTGIDYLFVDEAQFFKNLGYNSNLQNVADMGPSDPSQRAYDMKMKTDYIRSIQKGKGIVFGTATPIMNTPVEGYIMMQYLMPEELEKRGITNLDNFVDMFGRIEGVTRQNAAGTGWEVRTTFSGFKNIPEWQQLWSMVTDRVRTQDVPGIKLPKMQGGDREVVVCEAGNKAREVISGLADRLKNRSQSGENHIFTIQSDGKKASFSQKLIDPSLPYGPKEKVPVACEEIFKTWQESKTFTDINGNTQENGVQLVFCDKGVPGGKPSSKKSVNAENESENGDDVNPNKEEYIEGLNVYQDMKDMLVAKGIPAEEIAFIHDPKNETQTEELYEKVRNGEVRILIGSSMKMGEGLNVQDRVVALHEMNPLMRPGDVEQVEARAIRQGNLSPEVAVKVYVTENTFDTKQWDTLRVKAQYIDQITSGTFTGRDMDFSSEEFGASAGDIMAVSSGNPKLKEQAEINDKLRKLSGLESEHKRSVYNARESMRQAERDLTKAKAALPLYESDAKVIQNLSGENFTATVGKTTFDSRKDFGAAVVKAAKKAMDMSETPKKIGMISGFELIAGDNGSISLKRQSEYTTQINFQSDIGTATSIVNALKKPEGMAKAAQDAIALNESNIPKFKEQAESTFDKQAELDKVRAQARQIEEELLNDNKGYEAAVNGGSTKENTTYQRKVSKSVTHDKKSITVKDEARPQDWTAKQNRDSTVTEAKPLSDIIGKAMHDLGINLDTGYLRGKGVMGEYNTQTKGIRTKIANDLPSLSHELGHWFDDRYGILKDVDSSMAVQVELRKAFEANPDNKKAYDESLDLIEGVAEYIRYYFQNRDAAVIDYPNVTEWLKKKMTPKELADFDHFADEINAYYSLGAQDAKSNLVYRENRIKDFRTRKEKWTDFKDKLYQEYVDSQNGVRKLDLATGGHAHMKALNAAYAMPRVRQILEGSDLRDIHGNYVGFGFKTALRGVNTESKEEYTAFNELLVVIHAQDWIKSGKRVFADDRMNNLKWLENRQKQIEDSHPTFASAAERVFHFNDQFTKTWLVDTGIISEEAYKAMRLANPHYVPFFRAGFKTSGDSTKKAKGSGRDIIMPVDNIMDMVKKGVTLAVRNDTLLEIRKASTELDADATFLERIPDNYVPRNLNTKGWKTQITQDTQALLDEKYGGNLDLMDALGEVMENIDDTLLQFEKGRANPNKQEVVILVNGKPEFWKINDPLLFDSISSLNGTNRKAAISMYGKITNFMKQNITGNNIIWSIFSNAPRDLQTLWGYSKYTKNPFKIAKGLADAYVASVMSEKGKSINPYYEEFLAMGGGGAAVWSDDSIKDIRRNLNTTGRGKNNKKHLIRLRQLNPTQYLNFIGETIENGPRFATYELCRKMGMTPEEAFREAMDITVDFRRRGTKTANIDAVVPFFNAGLQSTDKSYRYYTAQDKKGEEDRGKASFNRLAFLTVTSVISVIGSLALNRRTDEDKKSYEQISNYTKNSSFLIPLGNGKYFAITKSHELGVPSSLLERIFERIYDGNDHALDEFASYASATALPSIVSDLVQYPFNVASEGLHDATINLAEGMVGSTGLIGIITQISANKDYLGRPIVSSSNDDLLPEAQYNVKSSQMAYLIGKYLKLSPQQIDHFGKNFFGWLWTTPAAIFPVNDGKGTKGTKDWTFGVKNTYFKDNLYSQDLTNWLYDKADQSQKTANTYGTPINNLTSAMDSNMKTFYSRANGLIVGEDRVAKQQLLNDIKKYRTNSDHNSWTSAQKFVQSVAKASDSPTKYLPDSMQTSIETQDEEEHDLTAREYIQYQKKYEELFYKFISDQKSGAKTQEEKEELISQAKNTAKEQAQSFILDKKGVKGDVKATGWSSYQSTAREKAKANDPEAKTSQTDVYNWAVDYAKKYGANAKDTYYLGLNDKQKAKYDAWESLGGTFDNYDEYLGSKEFDAIKDGDGNSISGSKKYQVAEYLANQVQSGNMSYPLAESAWEDAGYNKNGTDSLDSYYGSSDYNKVGNKIGK